VGETGRVQVVERADHPGKPLIHGVVAGRRAGVVPGADQRIEDLRRNGELGVTLERSVGRRERCLQVADGQVGGGEVRQLTPQHGREVEPAGGACRGRPGLLDEWRQRAPYTRRSTGASRGQRVAILGAFLASDSE
jgi:hypothetical protein